MGWSEWIRDDAEVEPSLYAADFMRLGVQIEAGAEALPPAKLTPLSRVWMIVLRAYLIVAAGLVLFRIVNLALGHA